MSLVNAIDISLGRTRRSSAAGAVLGNVGTLGVTAPTLGHGETDPTTLSSGGGGSIVGIGGGVTSPSNTSTAAADLAAALARAAEPAQSKKKGRGAKKPVVATNTANDVSSRVGGGETKESLVDERGVVEDLTVVSEPLSIPWFRPVALGTRIVVPAPVAGVPISSLGALGLVTTVSSVIMASLQALCSDRGRRICCQGRQEDIVLSRCVVVSLSDVRATFNSRQYAPVVALIPALYVMNMAKERVDFVEHRRQNGLSVEGRGVLDSCLFHLAMLSFSQDQAKLRVACTLEPGEGHALSIAQCSEFFAHAKGTTISVSMAEFSGMMFLTPPEEGVEDSLLKSTANGHVRDIFPETVAARSDKSQTITEGNRRHLLHVGGGWA